MWFKKNKTFKGGLVKKESGVWKITGGANLEEWSDLQL